MLQSKNGLMLEADENIHLDIGWGNSCWSWFVYSLCNSNVEDTLDGSIRYMEWIGIHRRVFVFVVDRNDVLRKMLGGF